MMSETCITSSSAATRGMTFLPVAVDGGDDARHRGRRARRSAPPSGSARPMLVGRRLGDAAPFRRRRASLRPPPRPRSLSRRRARGPGAPSALGRRQRLARSRRLQRWHCRARRGEAWSPSDHSRFVLELADEFGDRADLGAGLAARRLVVFTTSAAARCRRRSRPGVFSSIGFFFAFMMLGSEA